MNKDIEFITITFWNNKDLGTILYRNGWKQVLKKRATYVEGIPRQIDNILEKDGVEIIKSKTAQQIVTITFIANPYEVRALTYLPLHENIVIFRESGEEITPKNLRVLEPESLENQMFKKIKIEFIVESFTFKNTNQNLS